MRDFKHVGLELNGVWNYLSQGGIRFDVNGLVAGVMDFCRLVVEERRRLTRHVMLRHRLHKHPIILGPNPYRILKL